MHVVEPGADLPADLEDVAEAARHEHAHARRLALDDGVGRHGGGVDHRGHVAAPGPAFREAALQRGHESPGRVLRGGEHLDHPHLAGLAVHEGGVGERAADVDAHAPRGHWDTLPRVTFGRAAGRLRASAIGPILARALAVAGASRACVAGSTTTP